MALFALFAKSKIETSFRNGYIVSRPTIVQAVELELDAYADGQRLTDECTILIVEAS